MQNIVQLIGEGIANIVITMAWNKYENVLERHIHRRVNYNTIEAEALKQWPAVKV